MFRAKLPDGRTLMEAIAERDRLKQQYALVRGAAEAAKREPERYGMREIKWVARVDVAKLRKQAEDLAESIRVLNSRIQEANWKVTLEK